MPGLLMAQRACYTLLRAFNNTVTVNHGGCLQTCVMTTNHCWLSYRTSSLKNPEVSHSNSDNNEKEDDTTEFPSGYRVKEEPFVHHAKEGVVFDIIKNKKSSYITRSNDRNKQDILIKKIKDTIHSFSKKNNSPPNEIGYVHKSEKGMLVGALSPEALDWSPQQVDWKKIGHYYASLSKSRLTGLVVATALAGYAMAPASLEPMTLLFCCIGTGLTSAAANTINQIFEVPYDSQMDRTKNRVLVRGLLTPLHATCFAGVCATTGILMLLYGANGTAAALGVLNFVLYTSVYTPMKRLSIINTWIGSVVGAIPPLIGWAGCTGGLDPGAWMMAGILYAWQFPHFNSLSWNLRPDYSRAGYRMMAVTNPGLCRRVALRYSIGLIFICALAPALDVTTWTFAFDSLPLNGYLSYLAWRFYKDADSKSSRKLFMFSLIHLPAIMVLMIISKKNYDKQESSIASTTGIISSTTSHIPVIQESLLIP